MHVQRVLTFRLGRYWVKIFAVFLLGCIRFGEVLGQSQACVDNDLIVQVDDTCLILKSVPKPGTSLGSNVTYRCANRLIQRPTAGINYCPVEICSTTGWNNATLSCAGNECYEPGLSKDYIGKRQCGRSGTKCQPWSSQTPHQHNYVSADFPDTSIDAAGYYCRDPAGSKGQPWCFTNDTNIVWEYCDIPLCSDLPLNEGDCADCGPPADFVIPTDSVCSEYVPPPPPASTMYGTYMTYTCSSLVLKLRSNTPFCPVEKCTADAVWSSGSISCGDNECYDQGGSGSYQGSRACTTLGTPCIRWDEASISYTDANFPEENKTAAGAFCRDPDQTGEPWCFTTLQNNWGRCGVPLCENINFTACGAPPSLPDLPNIGGSNVNTTYTKMTQDQALFSLLETVQGRSNLNCATKCNKGHNCQLYTFNSQLQECILYQPDQVGATVVCSGPGICYRRNF